MPDWKELGEVPDSEEEDGAFESQDLPGALDLPTTTPRPDASQSNYDVYDVPDSSIGEQPRSLPPIPSEETLPPDAQSSAFPLDSSPLSSLASDQDLPSIDQLFLARPEDNSNHASNSEITTTHAHIGSPIHQVERHGQHAAGLATPRPMNKSTPVYVPHEVYDETDLDARQMSMRQERSLRPRKPIQEHPYLLENAHYSSFLRQHGVKPVRITTEAERRRRQGTPRDEDFVDESQNSGLPEASQNDQSETLEDSIDKSQSQNHIQELDYGNSQGSLLMAPLSSSPLKTSPLNDVTIISSRPNSPGGTDDTSFLDHELPDINELLTLPPRPKTTTARRRDASPLTSSTRKRQRHSLEESGRSTPGTGRSRAFNFSDPLVSPPRLVLRKPSPISSPSTLAEKSPSPSPRLESPDVSGPTSYTLDDDSDEGPSEQQQDDFISGIERQALGSSSESESELVTAVGRRIKGVLPASWLRLDQQTGREKVRQDVTKRNQERQIGQELRRGIAQRTFTMNSSTARNLVLTDSDDDSDVGDKAPQSRWMNDKVPQEQLELVLQPIQNLNTPQELESDDGSSIMEDDHIDYMPSTKKRQLKLSESFQGSRKRSKTVPRPVDNRSSSKQKKITGMFGESTRSISSTQTPNRERRKQPQKQQTSLRIPKKTHRPKKTQQPASVPLSILDVINSDAPRFLKIAARTVRKRRDQGRSSPRKKSIQLATRKDHVDAASVLHDWKTGSIRQRPSVTARVSRGTDTGRQPRIPSMSNHKATTQRSRKLPRTANSDSASPRNSPSSLNGSRQPTLPSEQRSRHIMHRLQPGPVRQAQLETDYAVSNNRHAFHSGKRLLDRLYQQKQRSPSRTGSHAPSELELDLMEGANLIEEPQHPQPNESIPKASKKTRVRRKMKPQRVDTQAPEYTQAHDPLPLEYAPAIEQNVTDTGQNRLIGLGPYGTHYTHHFEIFPFDRGVYFHESTLIGQGIFDTIRGANYSPKTCIQPRVSFFLGEKALKWDLWTEQVSSELGIAMDFIAEQVEKCFDIFDVQNGQTVVLAATSVLGYARNSVSFAEETQARSFIARLNEVLGSFNQRMITRIQGFNQSQHQDLVLKVYDRLLLTILVALRMCEDTTLLTTEKFHMQDLLKEFARTEMSFLLMSDHDIRKTYEHISNRQTRERGLHEDQTIIHSWVTLVKVLELGKIPRASFWDLLQAIVATPTALTTSEVSKLETVWEMLFSLLPLMEFNDSGVIIPGRRHYIMPDGWGLPQRLLKRVFELYKDNPRQAPSFNSYCRALVARCHYLVDQWGWRKPIAIIGLIFDFFGSQGLGNLRNEEVYRSPRFLEELGQQPNLAIAPEDRCFHVFLKLLALSLQKLKENNSINDVRNLVARTLPNHDRQYSKEQNIHERDLAALRNHHDLLCTLFWGAPQELRPTIGLIEGLVDPTASHKEASLINLRAWSQLARFVVAAGEAKTSFKQFSQWRDTFFQQILHLFNCARSDIQRQYLSLPKEVTKTLEDGIVEAMVITNQKAILDILHFSITSSLEVMKRTSDLGAAISVFNTAQLQHVFRHFAVVPSELDWGILRQSLASLDIFLSRIDDFMDEESQESENSFLEQTEADEGLSLLDNDISKVFFAMTRGMLSSRASKASESMAMLERGDCMEKAIKIAARLSAKLIRSGFLSPSQLFKTGKYGLFDDTLCRMSIEQRRYLVLFIATILKNGFDDLGDAGFSLLEVWALSIVKPRNALQYEYQLAEELRRLGKDFVPDAIVGLAIQPDYRNNRDLFEYLTSAMRRSMSSAGPSLRKILNAEYAKVLKLVMDQLKEDLKMVAREGLGHHDYVVFVRDVIALIRAQGSEICNVDDFFYHISKEYSPPAQDPQLQVPTIVAYGLRLGEGDTRAAHQLFFFLLNSFKASMMSDSLGEQADMLRRGMKNQHVLRFILGQMLPAILRVSMKKRGVFVLIDVYVEALRLLLGDYVISRELTEDEILHLQAIPMAALNAMNEWSQDGEAFQAEQIYVLCQLLAFFNLTWPSVYTLGLKHSTGALRDRISKYVNEMDEVVQSIAQLSQLPTDTLGLLGWEAGTPQSHTTKLNQNVLGFSDEIYRDIRNNWVITHDRITIQVPGKARGVASTQPTEGVKMPDIQMQHLTTNLTERVLEFCSWRDRFHGSDMQTRGTKHNESILF